MKFCSKEVGFLVAKPKDVVMYFKDRDSHYKDIKMLVYIYTHAHISFLTRVSASFHLDTKASPLIFALNKKRDICFKKDRVYFVCFIKHLIVKYGSCGLTIFLSMFFIVCIFSPLKTLEIFQKTMYSSKGLR